MHQSTVANLAALFSSPWGQKMGADQIGEMLRQLVFTGKGLGCYNTFDLEPGFAPVAPGSEDDKLIVAALGCVPAVGQGGDIIEPDAKPHIFSFEELTVAWAWDGDGILLFSLGDLTVINRDCKKSYGWKRIDLRATAKAA